MTPAAGLGLVLLSAITTAAYFTLVSRLMRSLSHISSNFFLCLSNYAGALILLPVWMELYATGHASLPDAAGWTYFLVSALTLLLSRELYFYAYSRTDVANITVFSALTPIYTLMTGFVFLHEVPTLRGVGGIIVVTLAIYSIFLPFQAASAEPWLKAAILPLRRIFTSLPILCGFLSTLPTAFGAVYQKKALQSMDIVSFSLALFVLIGTAALIIELCKRNPAAMRANLTVIRRPAFWVTGFLLAMMHVSFAPVLMTYHSAVALTFQRCSIVFQIIFAYYFLHQRDAFRRRLLASMTIVFGFVLLWNQS